MTKKIGLILVLTIMGCSYPTSNDVNDFFEKLPEYSDNGQSYSETKRFLISLSNPTSRKKDRVLVQFLDNLATYYSEKSDENILKAVDDTKIQAGFANYVCGNFYSEVVKSESAISHYMSKSLPIMRCVGLSFSEAEIENILSKGS